MSAHQKPRVPSYPRHKQSGQAIVTLPDGFGGRCDVLLGKHGTKESKAEYKRVVLEWEANDRRLPQAAPADITVAELIDRYWRHCKLYYQHVDGSETQEVCSLASRRRWTRDSSRSTRAGREIHDNVRLGASANWPLSDLDDSCSLSWHVDVVHNPVAFVHYVTKMEEAPPASFGGRL
jgi:hypothetical protein